MLAGFSPADRFTLLQSQEEYATEKVAGDFSEDLAVSMLASTLGMDYEEDKAWDKKKEEFRISDKIVRTTNITQSAVVSPDGNYTTVISAAVFIF